MNIQPIRTKSDYRHALTQIEGLMGARRGSAEGDRLDVLATLVEAYEARHFPMALPDPIEAIRFVMEQRGLTIDDLVPMIGRRNRVYEILSRRRPLTIEMIRRLHEGLSIPADCLIRPIAPPDSRKPVRNAA